MLRAKLTATNSEICHVFTWYDHHIISLYVTYFSNIQIKVSNIHIKMCFNGKDKLQGKYILLFQDVNMVYITNVLTLNIEQPFI